MEMLLDLLVHIEPLLLLAHVVVDHLNVLHRASLLRVLRQRYRPLVLLPHVLHEVLGVTDQRTLDRVYQGA